jgi:hypothetical protein
MLPCSHCRNDVLSPVANEKKEGHAAALFLLIFMVYYQTKRFFFGT